MTREIEKERCQNNKRGTLTSFPDRLVNKKKHTRSNKSLPVGDFDSGDWTLS
jgi:hypothetical protein